MGVAAVGGPGDASPAVCKGYAESLPATAAPWVHGHHTLRRRDAAGVDPRRPCVRGTLEARAVGALASNPLPSTAQTRRPLPWTRPDPPPFDSPDQTPPSCPPLPMPASRGAPYRSDHSWVSHGAIPHPTPYALHPTSYPCRASWATNARREGEPRERSAQQLAVCTTPTSALAPTRPALSPPPPTPPIHASSDACILRCMYPHIHVSSDACILH